MCNSHDLMNQPELHTFTFTIEAESKEHLERMVQKVFELVEIENASPFYTKENPFNLRRTPREIDTLPFGEFEEKEINEFEQWQQQQIKNREIES